MSTEVIFPYYYGYAEASKAESTDDEGGHEKGRPIITKTDICKYKTEMCKNFSEMGFCPYRTKCQFAHGHHELAEGCYVPKRAYRTKKCKSFWEEGVCRYGFRCQFSHYEAKERKEGTLLALACSIFAPGWGERGSRLNRMLEKKSN